MTGLTDLLLEPPSATAATDAFRSLRNALWPQTVFAVAFSLRSRWPSIRGSAIRFLREHDVLSVNGFETWRNGLVHLLNERLTGDTSWSVRRDTVLLLADSGAPLEQLVVATHDPHWRVRHAFLEHAQKAEISTAKIAALANGNQRTSGVLAYLKYLREDCFEFELSPRPKRKFYDADPAVMARELRSLARDRICELLPELPHLLGHSDERIRKTASKYLAEFGDAETLVAASELLNDPREFGWPNATDLFKTLSPSRAEDVAQEILTKNTVGHSNAIRWAKEKLGEATRDNLEGDPLALLQQQLPLEQCTIQRRAKLDSGRADKLIASPTLETSWLVLREACRITKKPFWEMAPTEEVGSRREDAPKHTGVHQQETARIESRCPQIPFGNLQIPISRMGLSGHYRLPESGFAHALDAGINVTFWEPNYDTMTRFFRSLPTERRNRVHVIAGSFAADARSIRSDVERTLKNLRLDSLTLFMLFWVRSWQRITNEIRDELAAMHEEGKIRMHGLSTHNRQLAVKAIEDGWNPVMVRHSIAHRGAEETIFPVAKEHMASLITFNNTCYGRLLLPVGDSTAPTAAECYRYTLSHDAVSCCLTAPSTIEQLKHNVTAFDSDWDSQRSDLLEHGKVVYEQDRYFRLSVRSVP